MALPWELPSQASLEQSVHWILVGIRVGFSLSPWVLLGTQITYEELMKKSAPDQISSRHRVESVVFGGRPGRLEARLPGRPVLARTGKETADPLPRLRSG